MPVKVTILIAVLFWGMLSIWQFSKSTTSQLAGRLINRVNTNEKFVALTFDGGPMPVFTENVLQLLESFKIKATFFLLVNL